MKTTNLKLTKLQDYKNTFDKITSQNAQNWKLAFYWVICLELIASLFEYLFFTNSETFVNLLPAGAFTQFLISLFLVSLIWACVYTFIFDTRQNVMRLILIFLISSYLFITQDFTLNFLLHNLEPLHLFQGGFSIALVIELIFKLIITYLLYQVLISFRQNRDS